jgi:hypothetical protein
VALARAHHGAIRFQPYCFCGYHASWLAAVYPQKATCHNLSRQNLILIRREVAVQLEHTSLV